MTKAITVARSIKLGEAEPPQQLRCCGETRGVDFSIAYRCAARTRRRTPCKAKPCRQTRLAAFGKSPPDGGDFQPGGGFAAVSFPKANTCTATKSLPPRKGCHLKDSVVE